MPADDSLETYKRKRRFEKTTEPAGEKKGKGKPFFVIQKHAARSLHYDFRLSVGGVLKSWAVPKGPSADPSVKHLAVLVEDHPIEYADFEGVIPKGEYGAGTVMVWDRGPYRNLKTGDGKHGPRTMEQSFEDGHVEVWLDGEKLKGGYALTRFVGNDDKKWLLVKMRDSEADPGSDLTGTETRSVISGLDLEGIAEKAGE